MDGEGENDADRDAGAEAADSNGAAQDDREEEQTGEQAKLTAVLCMIVLSLFLVYFVTLALSVGFGNFEAPEWIFTAWLVEFSPKLKHGLAALLVVATASVTVATQLYRNSRALWGLGALLAFSIALGLFLLFACTKLDGPQDALDYFINDARFDFSQDGNLTDAQAEAKRAQAIQGAAATLWMDLVAWLAISLTTVLGINSAAMTRARKLLGITG